MSEETTPPEGSASLEDTTPPGEAMSISRRRLLAVTALGAAGVVLGPTPAFAISAEDSGDTGLADGSETAATSGCCGGTLERHCQINNATTFYEPDGSSRCWSYNPTFHDRLTSWATFWENNTPTSYSDPRRIWGYGTYVCRSDGCVSMHNYGRALDISRIYVVINGSLERRFYARYDIWKDWSGSDLTTARKRYWATSASLHHHFRHVLTYLYNTAHHNHIHVDNQLSGSGNSTFSTGSMAQVYHVQACCRYIWGKSTTIDGVWGPQTSQHSHEVLVQIGQGGHLTDSQSHWLAFNKASMRNGYGTQSY